MIEPNSGVTNLNYVIQSPKSPFSFVALFIVGETKYKINHHLKLLAFGQKKKRETSKTVFITQ